MGEGGLLQTIRRFFARTTGRIEHLAEIETEVRQKRVRALVDDGAENRLVAIQLEGHVHVLRSLTGEHEHDRPFLRRGFTREHAARIDRLQGVDRVGDG